VRSWPCVLAGAAIGAALMPHCLLAASPDVAVKGLNAVELFEMASKAAAAGRTPETLALYDALATDPDAEVRAEARFRKGQFFASLGRDREAAATYRRLLDEKPRAARVRLELARLLAKMGNEPGALRELRQAQVIGLPPDIAAQITQLSRVVRSPRRAGGSIDVALAPDSNINRATELRTLDTVIAPLDLSADARQTSGTGIKLFGQAFARQRVAEQVDLVFRANALASIFRESRFNDVSASIFAGLEWQLPRDRLTAALTGTRRWYGGEVFADSQAVSLDWLHPIASKSQLSTSLSVGRVRFRSNPLQDGDLFDASVTVERALGARSGVAVGVTATRQTATDASYAYSAVGPTAYAWRDAGHTTFFVATTSRRLIADTRNFLFLDKRREWLVTLRVGATLRQITVAGLSPIMRFGFERNVSSIALYDYHRKFAEVGLTRSF
jgi:tetratricopeptide (TPR) repeat protein